MGDITLDNRKKEMPNKLCVLDIELEKFNKEFPEKSEIAFAGIGVYSLRNGRYYPHKYKYYLKSQIKDLEKALSEFPGIIIGHNIFAFDYRVLSQLISLNGIIEKSVDTLAFLYHKNNNDFQGIALDNLSQINLGKSKTLHHEAIELWNKGKQEKVIEYNKNDIYLTQKLWLMLLKEQTVRINNINIHVSDDDIPFLTGKKSFFTFQSWKKKLEEDGYILDKKEKGYIEKEYLGVPFLGDSSAIPFDKCPHCQAPREMLEKFDDEDFSVMTDGEAADYEAGTWGTIRCLKCGRWIDYEV